MAHTRSEITLKTPSDQGGGPISRPIDLTRVVGAEALARVEHLDMLPGDISREWIRRAEARQKAAREVHRHFGADS